jgi:NADPH:quinone reductase-like Zn-dependent oxidoreductase
MLSLAPDDPRNPADLCRVDRCVEGPTPARRYVPAMRAYGFTALGGPGNETFLDVAAPVAGPGELLVRVRAAGVNPGDWKLRAGGYGAVPLPAVLGREVAGTVEAVGDGVRGFQVGNEVFGGTPGMIGGWAELARVVSSFAAHRPDTVSPTDAATLPVAAGTAYDGLNGLALAPGSTLLVNGAGGGVGVAVVQLAVARGLIVIGTASPAKHDLLTSLGAVPVAYGAGVVERIAAAADGHIDAAFDTVGGHALRTISALVSDRTRLITIADRALVAELGGHGVERDRSTAVLDALAALVTDSVLDPLVTDVRPFEEAGSALAAVEAGHSRGKIAIQIS